MSNAIRYDSLLVHYLARELDTRLGARRLKGVRLDSDAHRLIIGLDGETLVWELHPTRGWIRVIPADATGGVTEAVEGWGGRRIPTQRRPRVRQVSAPPDERWIELEIDAGGPDRAARFVIELMTNQWNVLALAPGGTILAAMRPRSTGPRVLRRGSPYVAPGGQRRSREGVTEPVPLERWRQLLEGEAPDDGARALVRSVAWTSPLNASALLGPVDGEDPIMASWQRYQRLASLPPAQPQVLELDRPTPYPVPLPGVRSRSALSLLAAFETAVGDGGSPTLAPEVRSALEERLRKVRTRAQRMRAEVESAPAEAANLRRHADLLMAQLHRVRKGQQEVVLDDFEGGTLQLDLDPRLDPVENARAFYDAARKRERAVARLPDRVQSAVADQNRLEAFLLAVDEGRADAAELARWVAHVRPTDSSTGGTSARLPYRRFLSSGGLEIRVGKAGRANDDLTFRHAAPDDIWLHARDAAGAHVILRWGRRDDKPPRADLVEAAVLAALNSRARTSGTVPVDWTRRKYVRKPRSAPPGAVLPDRVSTLFVEPDPALPDRLATD